MEAFSLLKYWKLSGSGGKSNGSHLSGSSSNGQAASPTIVAAPGDTDEEEERDSELVAETDSGPFFDLEFAVPTDDEGEDDVINAEEGHAQREDANLALSPAEEGDVVFDGRIVQIDNSSGEVTSNPGGVAVPASLLRSATRLRVLMLGLRRSKSGQSQNQSQPHSSSSSGRSKLFTVKFKVDEVPIFSLLTRNSSNPKPSSAIVADDKDSQPSALNPSEEEEEKKSHSNSNNRREVVQKYLKMVKPLYVRVSKRKEEGGEKKEEEEEEAEREGGRREKEGKEGRRMKVLMTAARSTKHSLLVKKSSGSNTTAAVHSVLPTAAAAKRRDDSLIQQQDGIQGAILHCKRSFNTSSSPSSSDGGEASPDVLVLPTTEVADARREEDRNDVVSVA